MKKYIVLTAAFLLIFQTVFSNSPQSKTFKGRIISVNGAELIVKKGKTEKIFSLNEQSKIYDEQGDVVSSDVLWIDKIVKLTYNKKNNAVIEIQIIKQLSKEASELKADNKDSSLDKKSE
ncbi:MAG: hypothetical protein KA015_00065 [Spirochaetes bacterium]|nr:hypothetical protein [Spirochaetota bacterium]